MPKKILVALFDTESDVMLSTAVVHELKNLNPDSTIDFITRAKNIQLLDGNPDINKIIVKDNYYEANIHYIENGYDVFHRIGMANWLDTCWHHVDGQSDQHLVEWYAKRAGLDGLEDKNIYLYPSEDDIEDVDALLKTIPEANYFLINTGDAQKTSKDMPQNSANVIADFLIKNKFGVIQIGDSSNDLISIAGVVDFRGKITLKQSAVLAKKCKAYIGIDSAYSYAVSVSGKTCVIALGPTQYTLGEASIGARQDNMFYINAPKPNAPSCSPTSCFTNCQINKPGGCMVDIDPRIILQTIDQLIKTGKI
jgi:ADP-heptose:LPS heptosyltransferase